MVTLRILTSNLSFLYNNEYTMSMWAYYVFKKERCYRRMYIIFVTSHSLIDREMELDVSAVLCKIVH